MSNSLALSRRRPARPFPGPRRIAGAALLLAAAACSDLPLQPEESDARKSGKHQTSATSTAALVGATLWVDPWSHARLQADKWRASRPADAAQMDKIAAQPQVVWLGDWLADPGAFAAEMSERITAEGALPVFVLYNIPQRDCGLYSAGGAGSAEAYAQWIDAVAQGIGARKAAVILEPDAVAAMDCLSATDQALRAQLLRSAVDRLKRQGGISVYIDAGNARWHSSAVIAERLKWVGIEQAQGFALNVSNFLSSEESVRYGTDVSARVGWKHFVVDTSRNGLGPAADGNWCNPEGRALGQAPSTRTGNALVDAYLWVKAPGESDGTCNGGPRAGEWWPEYALGLAQRSAL